MKKSKEEIQKEEQRKLDRLKPYVPMWMRKRALLEAARKFDRERKLREG
ncbi:MAG: hypothetical protein HY064_03050 [Bacteroidetes bacterium]|nr:hypothetical protein [Bacteroidota bacterium]